MFEQVATNQGGNAPGGLSPFGKRRMFGIIHSNLYHPFPAHQEWINVYFFTIPAVATAG
jgi:hypothetical protein